MQVDENVALLQLVPAFAACDEEQLALMSFSAEELTFGKGDVIAEAGTPAAGSCIVLSGRVKRTDPSGRTETLGRGTLIAEIAMFVETHYVATVEALEPVTVLQIDRRLMAKVMQRYPHLAQVFAERLRGRLRKLAHDLGQLGASLDAMAPQDGDGVEAEKSGGGRDAT